MNNNARTLAQVLERDLPSEPVDGFKLEFWELSGVDGDLLWVTATYYVNTPWQEAFPGDERAGADLVDCWLTGGSLQGGRLLGWEDIREWAEHHCEVWVDKLDALRAARDAALLRNGKLAQQLAEQTHVVAERGEAVMKEELARHRRRMRG